MSQLYVHELAGLKPDALATYLAAVGVMRLLAEKDAGVRGLWRNEHFVLVSGLDWEAIERFFLEKYAPTPILAPWNMESGFFSLKPEDASTDKADETLPPAVGDWTDDTDLEQAKEEDDETDRAVADPLLGRFATSSAPQFAAFRRAIEVARAAIPGELRRAEDEARRTRGQERDLKKELKQADARAKTDKQTKERLKAATEKARATKKRFGEIQKTTKDRLIADVRASWGAKSREWLDAAVALDEQGEAGFTSLFGSGGNDGRMEFTKNFRYHLDALFDLGTGAARDDAAGRLRAAVFGFPTNLLVNRAVGQFFPGRAGGTNMGSGFTGDAGINPWEFVLMLEGAVALVAGLTRRGNVERARASSPFWVQGASAGFGSASQREDSPRGEQWLPLWSRPLRYDELVELVREGRAQVRARQTARAADLVRATARLGFARGIDSLQRFAYLRRNGQANLAVSTGRFRVASRSHQELLDNVSPWIDRLVWSANDKNAPASLGVVARRAVEALFVVCRQEATAMLWRDLLVRLGEAELVLLRAGKSPARRPLPRLSSGWLDVIAEGTPEGRIALRLALALASQHRPREREDASLVDSVRRHFLPLDDADGLRPRFKLDAKSGRVQRDPEQVCFGRDVVTDAIALIGRRSLWARSRDDRRERASRLPLEAVTGCEATLEEVGAWVRGEVSDETVLELVRPLLALDWDEITQRGSGVPAVRGGVPDPFQMLFRLAHLPFDLPVHAADGGLESEIAVRLDAEPLRRLAATDFDGALKVTIRRLEASGLRPVFRRGVVTPAFARRLAASLAFPIARADAARAARLVCKPFDVRDTEEVSSTSV